jgi:radical SAM superfamily enzyme YgiQ (UPF0313 family)
MARITLIDPPLAVEKFKGDKLISYDFVKHKFPVCTSVGLELLSHQLNTAGRQVDILKAYTLGYGEEDVLKRVFDFQPHFVGFTTKNISFEPAIKIAEQIKKSDPTIKIILGGVEATILNKEVFSFTDSVDYVIMGDGESAINDVINNPDIIQSNGVLTKKSSVMLPPINYAFEKNTYPERLVLAEELLKGFVPGVQTSRGCSYGACTFCAPAAACRMSKRKWTPRSAENVVSEIRYLRDNFGANQIVFNDDDFIGLDWDRAHKIFYDTHKLFSDQELYFDLNVTQIYPNHLQLLIKEGLQGVFVGIESFNKKNLRMYNKGYDAKYAKEQLRELQKLNLPFDVGFMPINPQSSFEDVVSDIYEALDSGITNPVKLTHNLILSLGTPIYATLCGPQHPHDIIHEYTPSDPRIIQLKDEFQSLPLQPDKINKNNLKKGLDQIVAKINKKYGCRINKNTLMGP